MANDKKPNHSKQTKEPSITLSILDMARDPSKTAFYITAVEHTKNEILVSVEKKINGGHYIVRD
jgi:hypothetical protein